MFYLCFLLVNMQLWFCLPLCCGLRLYLFLKLRFSSTMYSVCVSRYRDAGVNTCSCLLCVTDLAMLEYTTQIKCIYFKCAKKRARIFFLCPIFNLL